MGNLAIFGENGQIASLNIIEANLTDEAVNSAKISDNSITATYLAATLTLASGDFIDLSAITYNSTSQQGLLLPNAPSSSPFSPTSGEGYLAWDAAGNQLIVYNGSSWAATGGGGSQNVFSTFAVSGQSDVVSDSTTDTLILAAGANITFTTNASTDTITIASTGGGSQTPWTSDIDAENFSLLDLGTNITARAGLTIVTTTTGALTLDSGTTGTVNLGTGNNAKTIAIGTGNAGNTINIGTNNTTLDTINIGSALDDVGITSDQWSITNAGVLTVASCTGCSGGVTLDSAYTAGNTIGTDSGSNIIINLAEVATPTELTINNLDTAGTNAVQIDNGIA